MICPYCSKREIKVVDKREGPDSSIRRRRECLSCAKRFTTYERIEVYNPAVVKKNGKKVPYDREKIKVGLIKAFKKRPFSEKEIDDMVDWIEGQLRKKYKKEVTTKVIGETVIRKLKKKDKVAYLRFASVYKSFDNIKSFERELKSLK